MLRTSAQICAKTQVMFFNNFSKHAADAESQPSRQGEKRKEKRARKSSNKLVTIHCDVDFRTEEVTDSQISLLSGLVFRGNKSM